MLVTLSLPPGLNSDDSSFAAEGRWADGNNVRFVNGKPQVVGGVDEVFLFSAPGNSVCRAILPFVRSGSISIAYGLDDPAGAAKLLLGFGINAPVDVTPAVAITCQNWSVATFGSVLLAAPKGGTLYEQSGAAVATAVAAAPDAITYMLVTPERQALAFGCSEETSGTFNGLCIRGSDLENYADWTTTATNNAFEHILDGEGEIVAARMIGGYVAVWTTNSLHMGQFIGDPGQTYRFDLVDQGCGLVGPNAVTIYNQRAYWVGPDLKIRSWAPGTAPQALPCPIWRAFSSDASGGFAKYTVVSSNAKFNEIRIDHDGTSGYGGAGSRPSRYIAVCLDDGAWYRGAGGCSAIVDDTALASITVSYSGAPTTICSFTSSAAGVFLRETGTFDYGSAGSSVNLRPYIQTADMSFNNAQRRVMVRSISPDFEGQVSDVEMTLFVKGRPQEAALTKGPFTLATTTTELGCRCSGKLIAVKFAAPASSASTSFFRLGKPLFDVVPLGER